MINALVANGHAYHDILHVYSYQRVFHLFYEIEKRRLDAMIDGINVARWARASGNEGTRDLKQYVGKVKAAKDHIDAQIRGMTTPKAEVKRQSPADLAKIADHVANRSRKRPKKVEN